MARFLLQYTLLAFAVIYAMCRGGRPERIFAAIMVTMAASDRVYYSLAGPASYVQVDTVYALIDCFILIAMVSLALMADRFWTLWAASCQLIASLSHLLRFIQTDFPPLIYAIITRGPSWAQLALLIFGTWHFSHSQASEGGRAKH